MDQVKVKVLELEFVESGLKGSLGTLISGILDPHLRGDECRRCGYARIDELFQQQARTSKRYRVKEESGVFPTNTLADGTGPSK